MSSDKTPGYCFVFGCPRSGTTALTRLLHSHENVVIGLERYKYVVDADPTALEPSLFTPERFLDFRDGDTNITPDRPRFTGHYEKAEQRLRGGDIHFIGDKVLAKSPIVEAIEHNFPEPRFVFIYRDLFHVASSFCVRAANPNDKNWPEWKTHESALSNWKGAFRVADALIERAGDRVFVVRYERLFNGDIEACRSLFGFLGLGLTPVVGKHFKDATAKWPEHEAKPLSLTAEQYEFLDARMSREMLGRFDGTFDRQLSATVIDRLRT